MMQHHKYSLAEIDNLIPWEKEVYVNMLIDLIKEEFAEEIDLKSSEQQMIFSDYAYMIAKALQSKNKGKVQEEIMTLKSSLYLEQMLKSKE